MLHHRNSTFPTLNLQLSLLLTDFVAGVPKGNLTFGYVRTSSPFYSLWVYHTKPCKAVCESSKVDQNASLVSGLMTPVQALAVAKSVIYSDPLHSQNPWVPLAPRDPHSSPYNGLIIVLTSQDSCENEMR